MIPLNNLYEDEYTNYLYAVEQEDLARKYGDWARVRSWREYRRKLERLAMAREQKENAS